MKIEAVEVEILAPEMKVKVKLMGLVLTTYPLSVYNLSSHLAQRPQLSRRSRDEILPCDWPRECRLRTLNDITCYDIPDVS